MFATSDPCVQIRVSVCVCVYYTYTHTHWHTHTHTHTHTHAHTHMSTNLLLDLHVHLHAYVCVAQITVASQLEQWQETLVKLGSPSEDPTAGEGAEEEAETPDQIFLTSQEIRHMNERVQQWLSHSADSSAPSRACSTDEVLIARGGDDDAPDDACLDEQAVAEGNLPCQTDLRNARGGGGEEVRRLEGREEHIGEGGADEEGERHWMDARNGSSQETLVTSSEETLVTSTTHSASLEGTVQEGGGLLVAVAALDPLLISHHFDEVLDRGVDGGDGVREKADAPREGHLEGGDADEGLLSKESAQKEEGEGEEEEEDQEEQEQEQEQGSFMGRRKRPLEICTEGEDKGSEAEMSDAGACCECGVDARGGTVDQSSGKIYCTHCADLLQDIAHVKLSVALHASQGSAALHAERESSAPSATLGAHPDENAPAEGDVGFTDEKHDTARLSHTPGSTPGVRAKLASLFAWSPRHDTAC